MEAAFLVLAVSGSESGKVSDEVEDFASLHRKFELKNDNFTVFGGAECEVVKT